MLLCCWLVGLVIGAWRWRWGHQRLRRRSPGLVVAWLWSSSRAGRRTTGGGLCRADGRTQASRRLAQLGAPLCAEPAAPPQVIACVAREGVESYDCLPSLVVIGAFKGGTTGLRYKLMASGQFYTKRDRVGEPTEGEFWDPRDAAARAALL